MRNNASDKLCINLHIVHLKSLVQGGLYIDASVLSEYEMNRVIPTITDGKLINEHSFIT